MSEIEQFTQPDSIMVPCKNPFPNGIPISPFRGNLPTFSEESATKPTKPKRTRQKNEPDDEETVRKRDILVSVAVLGELEQYVGENVEPAKIRTMKEDKSETLFTTYEAKLGQEMTQDGMDAIVGSAIKMISWFVSLDDKEALKADLLENKPLRRSLGRHCAGIAERYGDFFALSKVLYDVVKHVKIDTKEETKK